MLRIGIAAVAAACALAACHGSSSSNSSPTTGSTTVLALTDFVHSIESSRPPPGQASIGFVGDVLRLSATARIDPLNGGGVRSSVATYEGPVVLGEGDYRLVLTYAFSMLANVAVGASIEIGGTVIPLSPNSFAFDETEILADLAPVEFDFSLGSGEALHVVLRASGGDDNGLALPATLFVSELAIETR